MAECFGSLVTGARLKLAKKNILFKKLLAYNMITHTTIKNFKSHRETSLSLSCLNILTGLNGVGKSSVFQALLLLRQSYLKNRLHEGIVVAGRMHIYLKNTHYR